MFTLGNTDNTFLLICYPVIPKNVLDEIGNMLHNNGNILPLEDIMKIDEVVQSDLVDFSGIPPQYYLIGLLSAFDNRFQAVADRMMGEISWKQFFAIICINMCREAPTLKELSEILGSSHQNVKQILLKLEDKGLITFGQDENDKRKQRIFLTEKCREFCEKNDDAGNNVMNSMFNGISEKDLKTTIETITKLDSNLKEV